MFHYICKTLLRSRNGCNFIPHNPSMVVSSSLIRYISSDADNQHSFTLSYLTKTCGLSPESALSASKTIQFKSDEKPDYVISSFQKFGFSKTDIFEMIRKHPKMLCCDPEKIIFPKVEFFRSKGISTPELVRIFTVNPWILGASLKNHLVCNFNVLIEMFQSEDKVIEVLKKNPHVLCGRKAFLRSNINTLKENGVIASNILWLISKNWLFVDTNPVKFGKFVEEVKEMGFNPSKLQFAEAIMVLKAVTKSKWDGKVMVYKKWGWSDKDITTAFKKFPRCMLYSEDKIMAALNFYVNELGLESSVIVNRPLLLGYSLKKRLIPRGVVVQYLSSKGLVKLDSNVATMFICLETPFLEKIENCFKEEAPHLIKLYNEKLHEAINEGDTSS